MSDIGNSCKETQIFSKFGPENAKIWHVLSRKCQIMALLMWKSVKGIIFTKIGLANGTILKLWAANPFPKFSQNPPVVTWKGMKKIVACTRRVKNKLAHLAGFRIKSTQLMFEVKC